MTPLTSTTFRTARIYNYVPPTLYVLNAAAITKPHAVDHLAADMRGYNVDVAIITETHLKRKHADHIVSVDGYTLFRRDRAGRRGGGVAVYVSSRLHASVWTSVRDHPDYELLWVRVQSDTYSAVIGALYHPPKPIYVVQDLLSHIDECLEAIANGMPSVLVVLAGDFNGLRDDEVVSRAALIPLVKQPTRGQNCLDRIHVNELCFEHVKVVASVVKSDHNAVIAYSGTSHNNINKLSLIHI